MAIVGGRLLGGGGPLTGSDVHRSMVSISQLSSDGYGSGGMRGTWAPGWTTRSAPISGGMPPEPASGTVGSIAAAASPQTASVTS